MGGGKNTRENTPMTVRFPKAAHSAALARRFRGLASVALAVFWLSAYGPAWGDPPPAGNTLCGLPALENILSRYERIAAGGGWPRVPDGPTLREGDRNDRVLFLKRRLAAAGDMAETEARGNRFDGPLKEAVLRFQSRHGLEADGLVGTRTLRELNTPVDDRIRQLTGNMERCRLLPVLEDRRHIVVNIADFTLKLYEEGTLRLFMPVIVGTTYRQTPVVSGRIASLVLNPEWNVPLSIATEDMLPRIKKDPGYLARQGLRVLQDWKTGEELDPAAIDWAGLSPEDFPYWLRQDPGPQNALGRVKFLFPNPHYLFLHDTPAREQFDKNERLFSSGCIRLARPLGLAVYLLQGTPLGSMEALAAAIEEGETVTVDIPSPMAIYIVYLTAWVDPGGTVQFRNDVYNRDGDP